MNGKVIENLAVCYFMKKQMKAYGLLTKTGSSTRMDCTQRSETSDKIKLMFRIHFMEMIITKVH